MECPHCHSEYTNKPHAFALGEDPDGTWQVSSVRCNVCDHLIVDVCQKDGCTYPAWPQSSLRARLPEDVPSEYAADYLAAVQVHPYSPESTAALSRRLLQRLLISKANAGEGALAEQIRRVAGGLDTPPYIKQGLEMYSRLADLESEPIKSLRPEALAPVKPGEAEWLLDLLASMLDLYFVQPARLQRKQDSLEEKLASPASAGSAAVAEAVAEVEAPASETAETAPSAEATTTTAT